ncbi:MAG TPA: hypothetical protein VMD29_17415 [Terracidiphilus sp.]|nr:hypothetical protein [Terracidiphilus sp.]
MRRLLAVALLFGAIPSFAAKPKPCVTPDQAAKLLNKEICISAHVYDVVELPNGTRFLDVCAPEVSDDDCRFTIMSLWQDRDTVGELTRYRDANVEIRGIVTPMHGRAGILLSHSRQFNGGPPKFRPNPRLARGFTAEQDRPPIADPNLRGHGSGRAFMNRLDQEKLPRDSQRQ